MPYNMPTIYHCTRPPAARIGYDEMRSCVVVAESPEIALAFADSVAGDERGSFEDDSTYWRTHCRATAIGGAYDLEPGTVCRDFNAG